MAPSLVSATFAPPVAISGRPAAQFAPIVPVAVGRVGLDVPDAQGRSFVAAASGLTAAGGRAWLVSDDLPTLVSFDNPRLAGGTQHSALPPRGKKEKYDFEAITTLPGSAGAEGLFAAGSGSRPSRQLGFFQPIAADGRATGAGTGVDLAELYGSFSRSTPHGLNIEGLATREGVTGSELLFFHRRRNMEDANRVFVVDAVRAADAAGRGAAIPASALRGEVTVDLGTLDGEPLGFSDARALPDGSIVFSASAEGAGKVDGPVIGSAIGTLDARLGVASLRPLAGPPRKVEGLELTSLLDPSAPAGRYTLVTDADDPAAAAEVLHVDA